MNETNAALDKNPSPTLTIPSIEMLAVRAALDKKADNIKLMNLGAKNSIADHFLICSAQSQKQVQAIADNIETTLRVERKIKPLRMEGYVDGRWALIDYGNLVVHIFIDALRDYYDLDTLWRDSKNIPIPPEYYMHRP